jgi:hypothetical protein
VGINLVIGCSECHQRIWFYRGELNGMESFYVDHRLHGVVLSDDQKDVGEDMLHDWPDVGYEYRATGPRDGI